ncbi:MAG: ferredoxin family protein [Sphingomonadaceae bacterium]
MAPKVKTGYRIAVNHNYCTGCGNCVEYCPMHVLAKDTKLNKRGVYPPVAADIDKCTGCKLCEMYCGNFAIAVGPKASADEEGTV